MGPFKYRRCGSDERAFGAEADHTFPFRTVGRENDRTGDDDKNMLGRIALSTQHEAGIQADTRGQTSQSSPTFGNGFAGGSNQGDIDHHDLSRAFCFSGIRPHMPIHLLKSQRTAGFVHILRQNKQ
jgi:hypothetical protein